MIRTLAVLGTRPEAIKMAPVIRELATCPGRVVSKVCVTAQHREMLDQVLDVFDIVPNYDLDLMEEDQSPTQVAAAVMAQLEPILQEENPDWVLVQGDTTTVAAAAWAAFFARVKVGHVEAGLRTHDKWRPFPEEINRKLAGAIADLHFAPTLTARRNLLREGVVDEHIVVTGNPVIDALRRVAALPPSPEVHDLFQELGVCGGAEEREGGGAEGNFAPHSGSQRPRELVTSPSRLILVTAHRRENFGQPLENICGALRDIVERYDGEVCVVYPVHLNPSVWEPVHGMLGDVPDIVLTPPLDYLPLVHLMKRCHIVLTDSGGIQEEAPGMGKPVLVLREKTERPEAVEAGAVRLVGTDRQRILSETVRLLENKSAYEQMAQAVNPYGDGHAAERIVGTLLGEEVTAFNAGRVGVPPEGTELQVAG